MVTRLPRLRRGPRPRTADDDDWGTASPPYDMPNHIDLDVIESDPVPRNRAPVVQRIKQQELDSYTLTFSPRIVITLYFAIGLLFIPLGIAVVAGTNSIRGVPKFVYSNDTQCETHTGIDTERNPQTCNVVFNVDDIIPAPSYFYYSLTNFYQNHRKYAKSRSDSMNQGFLPAAFLDVETCEPWLYKEDAEEDNNNFDPSEFRYPCGLTARSFFNDTFEICKDSSCDTKVRTRKEGIALWTDVQHKFRPGIHPLFEKQGSLGDGFPPANTLLTDENFIVWMRLSAFSDFDKLYHIIEEDLVPNVNYTVRITNNYPVEDFSGTKGFRISTVTWFGAGNTFLGTAYLVVGFTALVIATTLLVKHLRNPRPSAGSDPDIILRELAKLNLEYGKPKIDS